MIGYNTRVVPGKKPALGLAERRNGKRIGKGVKGKGVKAESRLHKKPRDRGFGTAARISGEREYIEPSSDM